MMNLAEAVKNVKVFAKYFKGAEALLELAETIERERGEHEALSRRLVQLREEVQQAEVDWQAFRARTQLDVDEARQKASDEKAALQKEVEDEIRKNQEERQRLAELLKLEQERIAAEIESERERLRQIQLEKAEAEAALAAVKAELDSLVARLTR